MLTQTALLIFAVIIILVLVSQRGRDQVVGTIEIAFESKKRKQENLDVILGMLEVNGEVTNAEVREALGVSDLTVTRYMSTLEEDGKVEQVATTDNSITYRLK